MSSKPAVTKTETESTKGPLDAQAPMWQGLWEKASQQAQNFTPFGGEMVAGPTAGQRDAVGQMYGAAGNVGTNAASTAGLSNKIASGYFMDPTNDPTFGGAVNAAINPITRALTETVLPQITDRSIRVGGTGGGPGAYGGSSQDMQQNQAVQNWSKQVADTTATMSNASRTAGMNLMSLIPGLNTSANTEALAPATVSAQAGEMERGMNQLGLDNELQKWNMQQNSTMPMLQQLAQILSAGGFYNGSNVETKTGAAPSMATQILQGVTGAAGIANSLFGSAAGGTSAAAGLGAAASSAGSTIMSMLPMLALSDRRLKTCIQQIGHAMNGLPIYIFKYLNDLGAWHMGFMADEVEQIHPNAVTEVAGFKAVDYSKAVMPVGA